MTSRLGERTLGALAGSCVVILVTLIALLWTGVGTGVFSSPRRAGVPGRPVDPDNYTLHDGQGVSRFRGDDGSPTSTPPTPPTPPKSGRPCANDDACSKEVEFVKPLKISPLPLHEEDIIYGADKTWTDDFNRSQSQDTPGRLHSGHFRHKMATLWDPHPQYNFTAFGRTFHLFLSHDSEFVAPDLQVTSIGHNQTSRDHPGLEPRGCFYSGVVVGDPNSSVAVSLCHGMTGHIFSSWGSFFIEPTERWHDHMTAITHEVYRTHTPRGRYGDNTLPDGEAIPHCGVGDSDVLEATAASATAADTSAASSRGGRTKRSANGPYYIEIMVVADKKMVDYHGAGLNHYILSLMHTVNRFYKHASVGNSLTIAVVKIVKLEEFDANHHAKRKQGALAPEYLRRFCAWQAKHNAYDEYSPQHYDTALLLTRENLCRNVNIPKCDTLGLAELGTMCHKHSSCSIVRDNGLSAAFTIAHELGHVLNMPHDDDERCRPFHSSAKMNNVMSRMLDNNTSPYSWSNCSRHFVTEFLDGGNGECLLNEPFTNEVNLPSDWLPGENFTEDQQCELVNGPGSKICSYMPKCSKLWCGMDAAEQKGCKTNHMPWADGTACKQHHWCQQGACVPRDRRLLEPVDGNWGDWHAWGECSRSCGGGVKRAVRYCDSPRNLNGGQYCLGQKVRYKSCNIHDCPPGTKDFREEQCSQHDGNNFNIQGLSHNVTWVPKYGGLSQRERCMLYCRVAGTSEYFPLRNQVIDGTTCGPDVHDVCVAGTCKSAGCNRSLATDHLKLDFCGECGGDNSSCHWVTGRYNESRYGYHQVVRVPAGSSNIEIKQTGHLGLKDDNYLVLVDGDSGEYLLNGKYSVTNYVKTIAYAGAKLQYSGSDAVVERLNSSHPIQRNLIIQVLSVGKAFPPNIVYKYTTMIHDYQWIVRADYTPCDKVCRGVRRRVVSCVGVSDGRKVDDGYCVKKGKPDRDAEECNVHCTLKWSVAARGECSAHCGPGQRHLTARCEQRFDDGRAPSALHDDACANVPRPATHEPCEGPCDRHHWQYREWQPCTVSEGACAQKRDAVCVDELGREVESRACVDTELIAQRQCGRSDCPLWVTDDHWTPCSVTCGEGESIRAYYCQLRSLVVPPHACHSQPLPPHRRPCSLHPCVRHHTTPTPTTSYPREADNVIPNAGDDALDFGNSIDSKLDLGKGSWRTGPWGECSRTCGGGMQRRLVKCVAERPGGEPRCRPADKPKEAVHCNKDACAAWKYGMWGECNSSCGLGFRHRQVGCRSALGEIVGDELCSTIEREPHYEECALPACAADRKVARWKTGPWGPCSRSCGQGVRVRSVDCASPDGRCELRTKPKTARGCKQLPCPNSWVVSDWTECSVSCGAGVQRRTAVCNALSRDVTRPDLCHAQPRPAEAQPCQMPSCDSHFYWRAADWMPCSHACGKKGRQIRNISCYHRSNKKVPRYNCPAESKPRRKRKCNQRKCTSEFSSCADVQRKLKATEDREYQLTLHGRAASVFCHRMRTEEPHEFLTLPNERDNFAEIYDRRLLTPDSCPDGGRRRDNCECVQDAEGKAGLTVYHRIRLNVTSLRVNTQDVTFARQVKGSRVAYAESGDCYSRAACPQGRFSVDLKGTPFKVARVTEWEGHGSSTSVDVRRQERDQRVFGKCGGYCGTCSPKARHGLTLDWLQPP